MLMTSGYRKVFQSPAQVALERTVGNSGEVAPDNDAVHWDGSDVVAAPLGNAVAALEDRVQEEEKACAQASLGEGVDNAVEIDPYDGHGVDDNQELVDKGRYLDGSDYDTDVRCIRMVGKDKSDPVHLVDPSQATPVIHSGHCCCYFPRH